MRTKTCPGPAAFRHLPRESLEAERETLGERSPNGLEIETDPSSLQQKTTRRGFDAAHRMINADVRSPGERPDRDNDPRGFDDGPRYKARLALRENDSSPTRAKREATLLERRRLNNFALSRRFVHNFVVSCSSREKLQVPPHGLFIRAASAGGAIKETRRNAA